MVAVVAGEFARWAHKPLRTVYTDWLRRKWRRKTVMADSATITVQLTGRVGAVRRVAVFVSPAWVARAHPERALTVT